MGNDLSHWENVWTTKGPDQMSWFEVSATH
jgi:hypothetical protein